MNYEFPMLSGFCFPLNDKTSVSELNVKSLAGIPYELAQFTKFLSMQASE